LFLSNKMPISDPQHSFFSTTTHHFLTDELALLSPSPLFRYARPFSPYLFEGPFSV
jgi:hypothetical protein